jgi:hypothetical protein
MSQKSLARTNPEYVISTYLGGTSSTRLSKILGCSNHMSASGGRIKKALEGMKDYVNVPFLERKWDYV